MPGTRMVEGLVLKGKGTSEPMSTSGFQAARLSCRSASAMNTMGGMPTPPPSKSGRGLSGCSTKGLPMGPRQESTSPRFLAARPSDCLRPLPYRGIPPSLRSATRASGTWAGAWVGRRRRTSARNFPAVLSRHTAALSSAARVARRRNDHERVSRRLPGRWCRAGVGGSWIHLGVEGA